MKALFISNGIVMARDGPQIGGGEVRWIEIARKWQSLGIEIHILTQMAGKAFCERMGLRGEIRYHFMPSSIAYSRIGAINRAVNSIKLPKDLENFTGIIYATTELAHDVIPGTLIKRKNPQSVFAVVAHWVAPLRREGTSFLNILMFFLGQRVGYFLTKKYADLVLAVSYPTKEAIMKKIKLSEESLEVVPCGVDYQKIRQIATQVKEKIYEGIFMKRLEGTKGVFDVVRIWKEVVNEFPDFKLILVGNSTEKTIAKLNQLIEDNALQHNIIINGPIYEFERKIRTLSESKLFLLPSYEENWAIVIGEALACGTPVICYDLPEIKPVWEDKIMWVRKADKEAFATAILTLLEDNQRQEMMKKSGLEFLKRYDWRQIAEDELKFIRRHENS
jgi:glycosyltransferase involved in cell wall biosynthesis